MLGSKRWMFPSVSIVAPSLHIRWNCFPRLPTGIWNASQISAHEPGPRERRRNNGEVIKASSNTEQKPEGFVPSQAHLENQVENSKN